MDSELSEFETLITEGEEAAEDAASLRVGQRLTDADIVIIHGTPFKRPVIKRTFTQAHAVEINYGDAHKDLHLTKIRSFVEYWTIDTGNGGHVHIDLDEIRNGLTRNQRRKIEVKGEGALVIRCSAYDLEQSKMIAKGDMIFIQPLYTNGIIVRGNVMIACTDEDDTLHFIPLDYFLEVKNGRVAAVSNADVAQEPIAALHAAEKVAIAQVKSGARIGGPKEEEAPDKTSRPNNKSGKGR